MPVEHPQSQSLEKCADSTPNVSSLGGDLLTQPTIDSIRTPASQQTNPFECLKHSFYDARDLDKVDTPDVDKASNPAVRAMIAQCNGEYRADLIENCQKAEDIDVSVDKRAIKSKLESEDKECNLLAEKLGLDPSKLDRRELETRYISSTNTDERRQLEDLVKLTQQREQLKDIVELTSTIKGVWSAFEKKGLIQQQTGVIEVDRQLSSARAAFERGHVPARGRALDDIQLADGKDPNGSAPVVTRLEYARMATVADDKDFAKELLNQVEHLDPKGKFHKISPSQ